MATPETPADQRILVAVDTSAASLLALELAADLAAPLPRINLPEAAELPELFALLRTHRAQGLILAADSRFAGQAEVESLLTEGGWPLLLVR